MSGAALVGLAAALGGLAGLFSSAALRRSAAPSPTAPSALAPRRPTAPVKVPLAAAAVCALLAARIGWSAELPIWLYLGVVGTHLAVVDWRTRRLPAAIVNPSYALLAASLLAVAAATGDWAGLLGAAGGWAAAGGLFLLVWILQPSGLGYGDVRLAGLLGLALGWSGWDELVTALAASLLLALLAAAGALLRRRGSGDVDRQIPFGPCLLAGALLAVTLPPPPT